MSLKSVELNNNKYRNKYTNEHSDKVYHEEYQYLNLIR